MTPREAQEVTQATNERLQAAVHALEAFSYSVSHELRAPLRTINAFTQALAEELAPQLDDRSREHLRRVLAATARMNERIDALLELAHIERSSLGRQHVDVSAVARAVFDEMCERDGSRQIDATIANGLVADADGALVRILFDTLISNAWKLLARTSEPRVEVGAAVTTLETVFYVRDNGAGFDMVYAERLFTPFQRLHTARRIVERHGGRIWAESMPGIGATFYFTLPPM